MERTKIVNLNAVRELLTVLDTARAEILSGRLSGVFAAFRDEGTGETIYLGGSYKAEPRDAMNAGMKAAAASSLLPLDDEEDEPSAFAASAM